ncbi:MAG: enoyl-CoA hydratase/isomerase family protein [Chlamydiae bacterium]|nr:enoyl-CoA hydratase/isomerase family protein [Chlamydiota bacterium]
MANFHIQYHQGTICLDREEKLHALAPEMRNQFEYYIDRCLDDKTVSHVLIYAKGSRAFCAGADIRYFYESQDREKNTNFCKDEYHLCKKLFYYPKPLVTIIDGIVMGGGVGLCQYGKIKIATENYQFAMPEVHIGFFPDVAISYLFTKMPFHIGYYLALTGSRIDRKRAIDLGLVTHTIEAKDKKMWIDKISQSEDVVKLLEPIKVDPIFIASEEDLEIERHFSLPSLFEIIQSLRNSPTPFAKKTLRELESLSAVSLLVTFEALKRAKGKKFEEVVEMDCIIAERFMYRSEIYEGIRAKIIDKDGKPLYRYTRIDEVPDSYIEDFFKKAEDI